MTSIADPTKTWPIANREYLMGEIARVRSYLQLHIQRLNPGEKFDLTESFLVQEQAISWNLEKPSSLDELSDRFGLSAFERDILLLCAGMEMDGTWRTLCATAQGDVQARYPTFTLALDALPSPNWMALTPVGALRRWRLIEIGMGNALTQSPLRIDERVLHYLVGIEHPEERLVAAVTRLPIQVGEMNHLCGSHRQLAEQVARMLLSEELGKLPIVQLCGTDLASKRAIASAVCSAIGWNLHVMAGDAIPIAFGEITELMRLWEREAFLSNSALLLDCDQVESNDGARESAIARIIENYSQPLLITSRDRRHPRQRPLITFEVEQPSSQEQRELWVNTLGSDATRLNSHIETLVSHFSLNAPAIRAACFQTQGTNKIATDNDNEFGSQLWETCRIQARSHMEDLAQRIESGSQWDDLVLPDIQRDTLREIIAHVRQRAKVYENWGFGGQNGRGLGITALFAGASGTGKTMAADIIAQELHLDLYRIDLSSVISKYIGETEKNLRRVFDSAEAGGSILLFDEADALFGKRSEVKDSHDRHANIEVAYLLQRMEAYRGLAILTTNLKNALDQAFLRRIRFVIQFRFPDASQREAIWRRIFPQQTPTQGLNYSTLAKLNVAGGNIRNIALNAAFIAADANEPVIMKHILKAAKSEYMKLELPLTADVMDSEEDWI